jgi:hypothetical protein
VNTTAWKPAKVENLSAPSSKRKVGTVAESSLWPLIQQQCQPSNFDCMDQTSRN